MLSTELLIYASAGGLLPALLWLWFWLKEDKVHPEPRRILALAFLAGMIAVIPAIALQLSVETLSLAWVRIITQFLAIFIGPGVAIIVIHAAIEELTKFGLCYLTALQSIENDEPIDSIIYMITTALGFAAVENILFIISTYLDSPLGQEITASVLVGNIRFVGSSLLHVAASATIGIALALAFKKNLSKKILYVVIGVIIAIALHTFFNFLIIKSGKEFLFAFPMAWIAIAVIILFFEKIKKFSRVKI